MIFWFEYQWKNVHPPPVYFVFVSPVRDFIFLFFFFYGARAVTYQRHFNVQGSTTFFQTKENHTRFILGAGGGSFLIFFRIRFGSKVRILAVHQRMQKLINQWFSNPWNISFAVILSLVSMICAIFSFFVIDDLRTFSLMLRCPEYRYYLNIQSPPPLVLKRKKLGETLLA